MALIIIYLVALYGLISAVTFCLVALRKGTFLVATTTLARGQCFIMVNFNAKHPVQRQAAADALCCVLTDTRTRTRLPVPLGHTRVPWATALELSRDSQPVGASIAASGRGRWLL